MGRGGTIYVATNPANNVPIGTPGQSVSIGPLGERLYDTGASLAPTSGSTVNVVENPQGRFQTYNITGAATLAALTLAFTGGSKNANTITINFFVAVTSLSFTGTFTGLALPTAATVGMMVVFEWNGTAWKRTV